MICKKMDEQTDSEMINGNKGKVFLLSVKSWLSIPMFPLLH